MLSHWIWLAQRPGLTDRLKAQLLEQFRTPEEIFYADPESYLHIPGMTDTAKAALQDKDLSGSEQILAACREKRLQILTMQDAAYPARLKNIADPPPVLYYKGRLPDFDALPAVAVVGTRKATIYGMQTAKRMGWQIGKCGGILVSGMAYGIDGKAMAGAIGAGGIAVGVLGCGADLVYPASNAALFRDVEENGCILSEFAPGTAPAKWTFPKRNRIISGLSCGVLVVEAPERSGALITARLAMEQGRDVFAVPGNIDLPSFAGSNALLQDGAILVSSGWDVLREYAAQYPDKIRRSGMTAAVTAYPDEVPQQEVLTEKTDKKPVLAEKKKDLKKELEKKTIDKAASSPYSDVNVTIAGLSEEAGKIYACLARGERLVDDLIDETGLSSGRLLAQLTVLELKGLIKRLPGKRITLK